MPTEYTAQMRKLRLPEQNGLKNQPERCSADPVMLQSIGRSVGQQVRITRKDQPAFVALYTVKQANPDADVNDPEQATVVRTGQTGRERLGTEDEVDVIVRAAVVDTPPGPGSPPAVRFFEARRDDGTQANFIAIAPHGGEIEPRTDDQAVEAYDNLRAANLPASLWLCKGDGDRVQGAFDRWHITSTDIQPACFPLLQPLMSRKFCYGVSFHGFLRQEDEADIYIGGGASDQLKTLVETALNALDLPIRIRISTCDDDPKFQGFSPDNIINRLAAGGIHLEQSSRVRERFHLEIARAVAGVFASPAVAASR
jgi:phage replication-related protein YjqB (UPF0714/DUF867 family)